MPKTPFSCLLCSSQALVKATQNPSMTYLSDFILDLMNHICMSYHWIVLSTANFRLQIFSETSSMACVALSSPLVRCGCWEADTVFQLAILAGFFSGKGLHLAHDKYFVSVYPSLTFLIKASHMFKDRWRFLPFHWKEGVFTVTLPFLGDLLSPKVVEAIPFCPHAVKS